MVRRRIARVERTEEEAGRKTLVLFCPRNEQEYRVAEVLPTPERAAAIQQHLAELLQMHGVAAYQPEASARDSVEAGTGGGASSGTHEGAIP